MIMYICLCGDQTAFLFLSCLLNFASYVRSGRKKQKKARCVLWKTWSAQTHRCRRPHRLVSEDLCFSLLAVAAGCTTSHWLME